jgi:hypothetical protein
MSGMADHQSATVKAIGASGAGRQLAELWHLAAILWIKIRFWGGNVVFRGYKHKVIPQLLRVKTDCKTCLKRQTIKDTLPVAHRANSPGRMLTALDGSLPHGDHRDIARKPKEDSPRRRRQPEMYDQEVTKKNKVNLMIFRLTQFCKLQTRLP